MLIHKSLMTFDRKAPRFFRLGKCGHFFKLRIYSTVTGKAVGVAHSVVQQEKEKGHLMLSWFLLTLLSIWHKQASNGSCAAVFPSPELTHLLFLFLFYLLIFFFYYYYFLSATCCSMEHAQSDYSQIRRMSLIHRLCVCSGACYMCSPTGISFFFFGQRLERKRARQK